MEAEAKLIAVAPLPAESSKGTYFAPRAYDIPNLATLKREVFGVALRVIRWPASELDPIINPINATGYGRTLGIHSRIDETVQKISRRVRVGNSCVNRNQIGALVGVQPFGDEGLSGTGPKADGPHYPLRFITERTLTINTTAAGSKATLLTLDE